MARRKRPPIEQLRAAGRVAKEMLVERGIIKKKSILDELIHIEGAPILPGLPVYLPYQWTIKATQRILYDLLIVWKDKCKDDSKRAEDITEFFKFVVKELHRQESEFNKEITAMPQFVKSLKTVPVLKDVFSPMRKKENLKAIHRFFVDSFAIAVILKSNHSTSEYANWFLDWSQDLYALWIKPAERKQLTRV